jgi:hypothetical protein
MLTKVVMARSQLSRVCCIRQNQVPRPRFRRKHGEPVNAAFASQSASMTLEMSDFEAIRFDPVKRCKEY